MKVEDIQNIIELYNDSDIITINYILKLDLTKEQRESVEKWLELNLTELDSLKYYEQREKTLNLLGFVYNVGVDNNDLLKYTKEIF